MSTYTVTYNVTLTIEVQADSADEAGADGSPTVSCHRIATSMRSSLPSHCDVNGADARGRQDHRRLNSGTPQWLWRRLGRPDRGRPWRQQRC